LLSGPKAKVKGHRNPTSCTAS